MKKVLVIACILILSLSFAACGGKAARSNADLRDAAEEAIAQDQDLSHSVDWEQFLEDSELWAEEYFAFLKHF